MKNKTKKKYTWNFLNNQNYVLGNTEKKKILSKFFIEKLIHFLYKMSLSFKSSLDLFIVLLLFIFFLPLWFVVLLFVLKVNPFIAFFLSTTIVFIFSIIKNFRNVKVKKNIKIRDLFISNNVNLFSIIFILWILLVGGIYFLTGWYILLFYGVLFIIFWTIELLNNIMVYLFRIKIIQIIMIPFYLLLLMIYAFNTFVYIFIFRWIKWFMFYKLLLKWNIIKNFDKINHNKAENKYYKIVSK